MEPRHRWGPLLDSLKDHAPVTESDVELIERFNAGDKDAGHLLFVKHYKMILKVVLDVTKGKWYDDDILQYGAVGLYEAARRFKPELGYVFLTYAVPWIRKFVTIEVCNDAIPSAGVYLGRDFKERLYRYIGHTMTGKTDEEIAKAMKISATEVERLKTAAYQTSRPAGLADDVDVDDDNYGSNTHNPQKPIVTQACESAEDEYLRRETQAEITEVVASLPEDAQNFLRLSFGLGGADPMQKKDLMRMLNLTAQQYNSLRRSSFLAVKRAYLTKYSDGEGES